MSRISVFIITRNEEDSIRRCLESVKWADEIVVVDSFSKDKTLDICREYTDNVSQREFSDFSSMKNCALSKASNKWVLGVDADEEVTPELRGEIENVLKRGAGNVSGFYVKRRSMIFGRWFEHCGTQNDYQMRFFVKNDAYYLQPVHEIVKIEGKTSQLSSELLHYTYKDIDSYIKRLDRYTAIEADSLKSKISRKRALLFLFAKPLFRFLDLYLLKQGFRDKTEGLFFSVFSGFYELIKYSKILLKG